MDPQNPPRWAADPTARHQYRYWDGNDWTDQVSDNGVVSSDPPVATAPPIAEVPPVAVAPVVPVAPVAPVAHPAAAGVSHDVAAPLPAYQFWMIAIAALTYAATAWTLQRFGVTPLLSACGAAAFAFGALPVSSQPFKSICQARAR